MESSVSEIIAQLADHGPMLVPPIEGTWPLVVPPEWVYVNRVLRGGQAVHNPRGSFGMRRSATRFHAGVDMRARAGTPVIAISDGEVVGIQGWSGPNARAILVRHTAQTKSGPRDFTVLYGATNGFTVSRGDTVQRGETIARVGVYPRGSSMLHLETYAGVVTTNRRWRGVPGVSGARTAPAALLDPTALLIGLGYPVVKGRI